MFCPECGTDHHAGEREEQTALDREVEMERLRTKRDVEVARINAGVVRDVTETEAEVATEVAEGILSQGFEPTPVHEHKENSGYGNSGWFSGRS